MGALPGFRHSAAAAAREKLDEAVFKTLHREILARHAETVRAANWKGRRTFAVDGSKISLPRPLAAAGYRTPGEGAHYPQGFVSALYRLNDRAPVDFDLFRHGNERAAAMTHLASVGEGDVVVYDRGCWSYTFYHAHRLLSVDGVFRIAASVNPAFDAFIASGDAERIVEIGPPKDAAPELKGTSHRVRLLRYTFADTEFRLATTLLDSGRYPAQALADLCHGKCSIEELHKSTKDMIGAFHAKSDRGVRQELYAAFVLETIGRLFSNRAEAGLNRAEDPVILILDF